MVRISNQNIKTFQWRIQDFPEGAPTPIVGVPTYFFANLFAENCMKMKEFGGVVSLVPPSDPPMLLILISQL